MKRFAYARTGNHVRVFCKHQHQGVLGRNVFKKRKRKRKRKKMKIASVVFACTLGLVGASILPPHHPQHHAPRELIERIAKSNPASLLGVGSSSSNEAPPTTTFASAGHHSGLPTPRPFTAGTLFACLCPAVFWPRLAAERAAPCEQPHQARVIGASGCSYDNVCVVFFSSSLTGLRVTPSSFGGDPTGRKDSWPALNAALNHCLNQSALSPNGYFPGEDSTPSFGNNNEEYLMYNVH